MEMGVTAIMANTAIATASDIPRMSRAFKYAIQAGREAYLAKLGRVLEKGASASSPTYRLFKWGGLMDLENISSDIIG